MLGVVEVSGSVSLSESVIRLTSVKNMSSKAKSRSLDNYERGSSHNYSKLLFVNNSLFLSCVIDPQYRRLKIERRLCKCLKSLAKKFH